jgi:site-specific DNA-methyltransferase (adenine-specific)/modification methylase
VNEIVHYETVRGDYFEFVKEIPNNSIDLILTDPPYNLSQYSTGNMHFQWRKTINNDLAGWDQVAFNPANLLDEFMRILKPTGNIFAFCTYNLIGKWHEAFDPKFDTFQYMVWHKTNPAPKVRRAGFLNSCELIVCMWNKGHTWNFTRQGEMHNFVETPICMGKERLKKPTHPTQKPVKVLKKIIEIASNPGDLVFDPFMGVGSTGVAALELGRRFLGIEIDQEYFDAAEERIRQVVEMQQLHLCVNRAQTPAASSTVVLKKPRQKSKDPEPEQVRMS